jgi:hypothetical protein
LWDIFIINSVEQLQTLPKSQSEIDISPFLKTQKTSTDRVKAQKCDKMDGAEKLLSISQCPL